MKVKMYKKVCEDCGAIVEDVRNTGRHRVSPCNGFLEWKEVEVEVDGGYPGLEGTPIYGSDNRKKSQ
jgi:hypothetical protein